MRKVLLLVAAACLLSAQAVADWGDCETGDVITISKGGHICYTFSDSDTTSTIRSFDACYDVDIVFDEDSDTCVFYVYTCTNSSSGSCQKFSTSGLTGTAGLQTYTGVPGVLLQVKCEGGAVSNNPQARLTCN